MSGSERMYDDRTHLASAADTRYREIPLEQPVDPLRPKILDNDVHPEQDDRANLDALSKLPRSESMRETYHWEQPCVFRREPLWQLTVVVVVMSRAVFLGVFSRLSAVGTNTARRKGTATDW